MHARPGGFPFYEMRYLDAMEYHESQKFNQWWLWAINFVSLAVMGWASYTIYQSGEVVWVAALPLLLTAALMAAFALVELRTTITEDGVEVRFWPFTRRRIFRSEIAGMHVRRYSPLGEYGGWGIRASIGNGMAYNVSGNMGLQLELRNGKKILIGTRRPEELQAFVERYVAHHGVLTDEAVSLELKELRRDENLR